MDKNLFEKLIQSASQAAEIAHGERKPSRTFEMTSDCIGDAPNLAEIVEKLPEVRGSETAKN